MRVKELAERLGCPFEGDAERELSGVAALEAATEQQAAFVGNRKAAAQAAQSLAGCLIIPADAPNPGGRTVIRAKDPRGAFARAIRQFHPAAKHEPGVHPSAVIAPTATLGRDVSIAAHVTIEEDARIGGGSRIGPGCAIGRGATIGAGSVLYPNVTIYDHVDIGARAILHAGCVIGADGFGFVLHEGRYEKFPQVGRVWIGDDVEVGANTCIDRAALGVTHIGHGVKLDNMVHIGHNCHIGNHVVIAAQTGLSGGVIVEDYAVIGGQVGIGDKARIESKAVLGSGCGVLTSKVVRGGEVVWGTPARPLKEILEQLANLARLPAMRKELNEVKAQVAALVQRLG
jgi:UDP-3-O-[3-hydroxymyristoyl] glucosamine N-acyltransferase